MKKIVAIRKEKEGYLAYFFEQRIMLNVNKSGAEVLGLFLNERKDIKSIAKSISSKCKVNLNDVEKDVYNFLKEIYNMLTTTNLNNSEDKILSGPIGCEIEITTACNLRCKHCFQGEYPEKYMSIEKFKTIIDILEKAKYYTCRT